MHLGFGGRVDDDCVRCGFPMWEHPCRRCAEADRHEHRRKLAAVEALGGIRAYEEFTFERFRVSPVTKAARAACEAFDPSKDNLYLWSSGPGTGKTHLATAAARRYVPAGNAIVLKPQEIFGLLRATYDDRAKEQDRDVLTRFVNTKVLVLDDLGVSRTSNFTAQVIYDLIEGRCMHTPTGMIVTSNLSLERLGESSDFDERVVSRLHGMMKGRVFDLSAEPDHRRM